MNIESLFSQQEIQELQNHKSILLVSGGCDSVFLFHKLIELQKLHADIHFEVIHFNHHRRGTESDADQLFVEDLCRTFSIACHVGDLQFKSDSGMQAKARHLRRRESLQVCERLSARTILMAHHADDQLETLIMKLSRGAGISGMCGIQRWKTIDSSGIRIFRPLLDVRKEEIKADLMQQGLKYREDASNASPKYFRNRVRHMLLSDVSIDGILQTSLQVSKRLLFSANYFELRGAQLDHQYHQFIPWKEWQMLATELKFRWLQRRLKQFGFRQQFERRHFEMLKNSDENFRLNLGPCDILKDRSGIRVARSMESLPEVSLRVPSVVHLGFYGLSLKLSQRIVAPNEVLDFQSANYLDADKVEFPIKLRSMRSGDVFCPAGKHSARKLGDFFQAQKIGLYQRQFHPILVDAADRVICVIGLGVSELVAVNRNHLSVRLITIHKLPI